MRILAVDRAGDGLLDVLIRAKRAGHQVRWYLGNYDRWRRPVGRGLVEMVNDYREWEKWADLVILPTNDRYMAEMEAWQKRGVPVIGGTPASAAWEIDRLVGMKAFKEAKIPVPTYKEFQDYDSAIRYVKSEGRAFVSKPCWAEDNKALTYVGKSADDMLYMLQRWKRKHGRPKGPFILQEKIKGIEFAVGGWFGRDGFCGVWEENHEFKKLMPGDIGMNTGEMGTVMRFVNKSKLADKVLKPLAPMLHKLRYTGNIDVNCIVDDEGNTWPLEFTMRCGWPAFNIEQALCDGDYMKFLADLQMGECVPPHCIGEVAVGVIVAIGDFPHSHMTRKEVVGIPIWGLSVDDPNVHLCEAQMVDGELRTAGDYVMVVTGTGATVQAARRAVYRRLDRLEIPASPFWRIDIGQRLSRELPELQKHGYAMGMEYAAGDKMSKSSVDFEHPAQGPHHCSQCRHFLSEDEACKIVAGHIEAIDWCKKFSKR